MNKTKETKSELTMLAISSIVLAITIFYIVYAVTSALAGNSTNAIITFACLLFLVILFVGLLVKYSYQTPLLRITRFVLLLIYHSGFTFVFGFTLSGAVFSALKVVSNSDIGTITSLTVLVTISTILYSAPMILNWKKQQFLKDTKAAIFIVNALMLVIFEMIIVYPNLFALGNELTHLYTLPTFISGLIIMGILEYKFATTKRVKWHRM